MNENKFALGKTNFVLMAVAVLIIIVGFVLMGGEGSTADTFNPEIFSVRRIVVAPIVCVVGFFGVGFAIMYRGRGCACGTKQADAPQVGADETPKA